MLSNNATRSTVKTTLVKALMARFSRVMWSSGEYERQIFERKEGTGISSYGGNITWVHFQSKSRTIGQYGKRE